MKLRSWHGQALGLSTSNTDQQNKLNLEKKTKKKGRGKRKTAGMHGEEERFLHFKASGK